MAFQAVPNTVQVQFVGRQDGQTIINDLSFFHSGGDPTSGDMALLLDALADWYSTSITSLASSTYTFVLAKMRLLTTQSGLVLTNALHGAAGGVGGSAAPNEVTFAVSFRTAVGGRGGRGRNYIPGIPDQARSGNTISTDFITNYINAYSALLLGGGVVEPPWAWVIVHRVQNGVVLPEGEVNSVEAVVATDNVVDAQRRRGPGRGA